MDWFTKEDLKQLIIIYAMAAGFVVFVLLPITFLIGIAIEWVIGK